MDANLEAKRYPIGLCNYPEIYTPELLKQFRNEIDNFPAALENVVQHFGFDQLQTPYREGGWTINQVIHHCADSHLNAVLRIKLALSNDNPTINPYPEALWAEMPDYDLPFNNSLTLLFAIHRKLVKLIDSLNDEQWNRTYFHPQYHKTFTIKDVVCLYAWHGKHHLAHITNTKFKHV